MSLTPSQRPARYDMARDTLETGDGETVQTIPGHQQLDHGKPYLTVDQETFRQSLEVARWSNLRIHR